jgi:hypothetical protein
MNREPSAMPYSYGHDTDFVVGDDSFEDLEIADSGDGTFFYFKHRHRSLVKQFVLARTGLRQVQCRVTLIKDPKDGAFEPRFEFENIDLTKKSVEQVSHPVTDGESRLVKARVDLRDCHENFSKLLKFIGEFHGIRIAGKALSVVSSHEKARLSKLLTLVDKETAIAEFAARYSGKISESDLNLIAGRKKSLGTFYKLLTDPAFFRECKAKFGPNDEAVWQKFFERNTWIFGYGLHLISCASLDQRKMETTVVGNDIVDGAGKRTDALLKTRGRISKFLFGEIKTHKTPLLAKYDRPGVYVPGTDLQGAVGQVQKNGP